MLVYRVPGGYLKSLPHGFQVQPSPASSTLWTSEFLWKTIFVPLWVLESFYHNLLDSCLSFFLFFNFILVYGYFACLCITCMQCQWRPEGGRRPPGTGITDGGELLIGSRDSNSGPPETQPVLLVTELSLDPLLDS